MATTTKARRSAPLHVTRWMSTSLRPRSDSKARTFRRSGCSRSSPSTLSFQKSRPPKPEAQTSVRPLLLSGLEWQDHRPRKTESNMHSEPAAVWKASEHANGSCSPSAGAPTILNPPEFLRAKPNPCWLRLRIMRT